MADGYCLVVLNRTKTNCNFSQTRVLQKKPKTFDRRFEFASVTYVSINYVMQQLTTLV